MAEFCRRCFIDKMLDYREQEEYDAGELTVQMSDDDDLCEACGSIGPIVERVVYNKE